MVPGLCVQQRGFGFVDQQRILVDVVSALVGRLGQQADWLLAYGLSHGYKTAGFKNVVQAPPGAAAVVGPGRGAFPGEGVAVPAVEGEAAAQFALFTRLFVVVPLRAGFGAFSMVGVGAFTQATTEGVVDVVDAQARVVKARQAIKQVLFEGLCPRPHANCLNSTSLSFWIAWGFQQLISCFVHSLP